MSKVMRMLCVGAVLLPAASIPAAGRAAQVEMDHILARVSGRLITQSDVRQAKVLRLVDDVSSDAAVQRGLEDRFLILGELPRAVPVPPPSDSEIAAHRAEWVAGLGGSAQLSGLLTRGGMSDTEVTSWLGEDLRIRAYLKRQFGMLAAADRAKATGDWLARLRLRAGLP